MATSTRLSLSEYMKTSYTPDREYVDGELRERNVGKWEHARLQALLAGWFQSQEKGWSVKVATEQRYRFPQPVSAFQTSCCAARSSTGSNRRSARARRRNPIAG